MESSDLRLSDLMNIYSCELGATVPNGVLRCVTVNGQYEATKAAIVRALKRAEPIKDWAPYAMPLDAQSAAPSKADWPAVTTYLGS